jgi:hypothetical protein
MLFLIHCANHPDLAYRGGQDPVLHLEGKLHAVVEWAEAHARRWAFTLSNAASAYCEDRCDLGQLGEINWAAVGATIGSGRGVDPFFKDGKQAECLVEGSLPWELIDRIGVRTSTMRLAVEHALRDAAHRPPVVVRPDWYY